MSSILTTLVLTVCATAPTNEFSMEKLNQLVELRQAIESINQLEEAGVDIDAEAMRKQVFTKAEAIAGQPVDCQILKDLTGSATSSWEKMTGWVTFTNICLVTGVLLIVAACVWLFGLYFLILLELIPEQAWEIILYGVCGGLIYWGTTFTSNWFMLPELLGCVGLWGCLALTQNLHFPNQEDWFYRIACFPVAIVWGLVAAYLGSHILGFMAVGALMCGLGFTIIAVPGVVIVGFEKDDPMIRATTVAGIMLAIHVVLQITGQPMGRFIVFQEGLSFLGTFVYFLGLLIMSSKWYHYQGGYGYWNGSTYLIMQGLCIGSGVLAIWLGSVYGLSLLLGVGGTLFYLYLIEKYYEIPWEGAGWAWSLLGLGVILYFFAGSARNHPEYFFFMYQ